MHSITFSMRRRFSLLGDYVRAILLSFVVLVASAAGARAHVETLDIRVISFTSETQPDRYVIVFDAVTTDYGETTGLPAKRRKFEVHLRCEPRLASSLETYRECVRILRQRLSRGAEVRIGRMSGRGWRPVPGGKGMFESVGLDLRREPGHPSDDRAFIYFIHDDRF